MKRKLKRKHVAGWYGMEEAKKTCQQAARFSPLSSVACSKPHHFTFATVRRREGEEGEKEVTSTWTTACLCLLKARKSPPSRASFWCCRPPACHTVPASDYLLQGQQGGSADLQASTGPRAGGGKRREGGVRNNNLRICSVWLKLKLAVTTNLPFLLWIKQKCIIQFDISNFFHFKVNPESNRSEMFGLTNSLGDRGSCCSNMDRIIRCLLWVAHPSVSHWNNKRDTFSGFLLTSNIL